MNAITQLRRRIACGYYDPAIPLADQLATASRQLVGMIEAGELRRLPGASPAELRGLAMFMAACSGEARDLSGDVARLEREKRERRPWWAGLLGVGR